MSTQRLQHTEPQYAPPEDDPLAPPEEYRQVWSGKMRIVGCQRARKLRRRGVPIMRSVEITSRGRHRHAWFVESAP